MKHIMVTTTVLAVYLANNRATANPYEKADSPAIKPSFAFTRPKIPKMDVRRQDARRMDLRRTDHERGENRQNKIQTKDVRKIDVRRMDLRRMDIGRKDVSNMAARTNDKQTIDVQTRHVGRMNIRRQDVQTMNVRKDYTQIKDVRDMKSQRKDVITMNVEKNDIHAIEFQKMTIQLTENPKKTEQEFPIKDVQKKIVEPMDVQITGAPKINSHGRGVQKLDILKIDEQRKDVVKPMYVEIEIPSRKSKKNPVRSRNVREKDVITYSNILQTIKSQNFAKASHQRKDIRIINKPITDARKKNYHDMDDPPAMDFPTIDFGLRRDETVSVLRNNVQTVDIPTIGIRENDVPGIDVAILNVRRNIGQTVDQKKNSLTTDFPALEVPTMGVLRNLGQTMDLPSIKRRKDIPAMNIAIKTHVQTMDDPSRNDFPIINVPTTRDRSYDNSVIDFQKNNALKTDFLKLNKQDKVGKIIKVQTKNIPKRDNQMTDLPAIDVRNNTDSISDVPAMYILKNPVQKMDLPSTEDQKKKISIVNAILKKHVKTIDVARKSDFPVKDYPTMNARSKDNSTKDVIWNNVSRIAPPTMNPLRNLDQTVNTWPIVDQRKDISAIDAARNYILLTDAQQRNDFPRIDYPTIDTRSKNISPIYNVKNNLSMVDFLNFSSLRNLVKAVKNFPKEERRKDFPLIDDLKIYIQTVNMPQRRDFPIMEVPTIDDRSKDISTKDVYRSQVSANNALRNHVQSTKFQPIKDIKKLFSTYAQTMDIPRKNNVRKMDYPKGQNQDFSIMGKSNVLIEDILKILLQTINVPQIKNQRKDYTSTDVQTLDVPQKNDFSILQVPNIDRQSMDVLTYDAQRNHMFMTDALKDIIQKINVSSKHDLRKDFPIMDDLKNHVQAINVQQRNNVQVSNKDSSEDISTTADHKKKVLQVDVLRNFVQGINYQQKEDPGRKIPEVAVLKNHFQTVNDPKLNYFPEIQVPKIDNQSKDASNSRTPVVKKNVSLEDILKYHFHIVNEPQINYFSKNQSPKIDNQNKYASNSKTPVLKNNVSLEDILKYHFQTMNDSKRIDFPKMQVPQINDQRNQDISASTKDVKKENVSKQDNLVNHFQTMNVPQRTELPKLLNSKIDDQLKDTSISAVDVKRENVSIIDVLKDLVQTMIIPPITELLTKDALRSGLPRRNDFPRKDVPTIDDFSRNTSTIDDVKINVSRKDVLRNLVQAMNVPRRNDGPRIDFPTIDNQIMDISTIVIQRNNISNINDLRNIVQPINSAPTNDKKKDFLTVNVPQTNDFPYGPTVDDQSKDISTLNFRKMNVSIKDILKKVVKSINVPTTGNQKNDFYRMNVKIIDHNTKNISTTDIPRVGFGRKNVPKINVQSKDVQKMDFLSTDVSPADGLTGSTLAEAPDPVRFFTTLEAPPLSQRKYSLHVNWLRGQTNPTTEKNEIANKNRENINKFPLDVGWLKGINPITEENVNANKNQENMDKFMLGDDWVKDSPQPTDENEIAIKNHEDMDASSFIAWLSGLGKSTIKKSTDSSQTRNYELTRLRRVTPFQVHRLTDRYKFTTESKEIRQKSDSQTQIKPFGQNWLSATDQPESTTESDGIHNKFQFQHKLLPLVVSSRPRQTTTTDVDDIPGQLNVKKELPPTTNIPIMTDENVLKKDFEELQKIPLTIVWLDQRKKPAAHAQTTAMTANKLKIAFDKDIKHPLFSGAQRMRSGLPRNADHVTGLTARPRRGPRKNERVLRAMNIIESINMK